VNSEPTLRHGVYFGEQILTGDGNCVRVNLLVRFSGRLIWTDIGFEQET